MKVDLSKVIRGSERTKDGTVIINIEKLKDKHIHIYNIGEVGNEIIFDCPRPNLFHSLTIEGTVGHTGRFGCIRIQGEDLSNSDITFRNLGASEIHIDVERLGEVYFNEPNVMIREVYINSKSIKHLHFLRSNIAELSMNKIERIESLTLYGSVLQRFITTTVPSIDFFSAQYQSVVGGADTFLPKSFQKCGYERNIKSINIDEDSMGFFPNQPDFKHGYKRLRGGHIAKMSFPEGTEFCIPYFCRKVRASQAFVEEIRDSNGTLITEEEIPSQFDETFMYMVGKVVVADEFNKNPMQDCAQGIHFFWTKEEAEQYK